MQKPVAPSPNELALSARLNPQERLALSRKALVRHMSRDSTPHHTTHQETTASGSTQGQTEEESSPPQSRSRFSSGTLGLLKRGLRTWWRQHPANFAVSVAQPLLGRYASQSPFRLLAISAGVGAALVVIKPWRLVSLGGIALAALKSSEFSGLLSSMLASQPDESDPPV